MLKDLEQKSLMKGKDLAENFAQWFDELYLGKYDLIPFFKVNKISDESAQNVFENTLENTLENVISEDKYENTIGNVTKKVKK